MDWLPQKGTSLHWWKNEVARATSKMTKYFELLHGSVEEGGGVKCIKGGESTFFRVFKLIVKNQGKKCYKEQLS